MKFWPAMIIALAIAPASRADDSDRLEFGNRSGRLLGQIVACGGHQQFGEVDKKVRDRAWLGASNPGPIIDSYLKAKRSGLDEQKTNGSGITCDEVNVRFEKLIQDVNTEAN